MQIEVATERLREGIGTAMFKFASTKFEIFHSPDMHCTREGLAFKQAVGGEEIDPELAYQP